MKARVRALVAGVLLATIGCLLLTVGPAMLVARAGQDRTASDGRPLVRVDAVVTDRRGHAVPNLQAADFEIVEQGTERPVRTAEFRAIPRHSPVPVLPIVTDLDERRAAAETGTRVFAFFLDEFHVGPGASTVRVRDAVASFVDQKLFARDLAAVITPLDPIGSLRFTRDRALVHGPIANFSGRKGEYAPRTTFEAQHIGRDPAAVIAARRQMSSDRLRELATRLGALEAEHVVLVILSEGYPSDAAPSDRLASNLEAVARAASRSHLTIYSFNPAGLDQPGVLADPGHDHFGLMRLATDTGGLAVQSDGFIAGFARVYHDSEAYYALAYEPIHDDGAFHEVRIRARPRDVKVRTHAGYWATPDRASDTPQPVSPPIARRPLRRSPLIDQWVGVRRSPRGDPEMVVVWEPRVRGAGSPQIVMLTARDETGAVLFEGRVAAVGSGEAAERDQGRFTVHAGRVELDMSVRTADGAVLDSDASHVDVAEPPPPTRPGPVVMSPEIVRRRTLPDIERARVDPNATPSAVRTFARGDRLLIRVGSFDATGVRVAVSATLLDRAGRPIRELETADSRPGSGLAQFSLSLSWLAADEYQIEVSGSNVNGAARERLTFRLVN